MKVRYETSPLRLPLLPRLRRIRDLVGQGMSLYKRILFVVYLLAIAVVCRDVFVWRAVGIPESPIAAAKCEPANGCGLPAHPPRQYKT